MVHSSTPTHAEVLTSFTVLTAGNTVRFTVVSKDAYGNKVDSPVYKSALAAFSQDHGEILMPVGLTSNEVQFEFLRKSFFCTNQHVYNSFITVL
jgi:hypothetical protein